MAQSRVTIKDLAEKMNLSISTISRALQGHHSIGKKTTDEVQKMAKKMGYFPNAVAANLRQNKTHSIGVIVPRIDIHFHSHAISGIEEVAYRSGYNVSIFQSRDSVEREIAVTDILQARMVEGVIACLGLETTDSSHFKRFHELKVPLVFYDRVGDDLEASKVIIDDYEAAVKATQHLIGIGCKRIAHIAGNQSTSIFQSRLKGYQSALKQNKLKVDKELICFTSTLSYEEGVKAAEQLLKLKERPDGIFCANDNTAISAIQVFRKAGLKVPEDIAVVGFSNYPISSIIEPKLTTIDDRAFEMGQAAAKLLIRQIEDKDSIVASETIVLKTELIVRDSTTRGTKTETS